MGLSGIKKGLEMKNRIIALFLCIFMLSGVLALSPVIATDVDPELEIAACNLAF